MWCSVQTLFFACTVLFLVDAQQPRYIVRVLSQRIKFRAWRYPERDRVLGWDALARQQLTADIVLDDPKFSRKSSQVGNKGNGLSLKNHALRVFKCRKEHKITHWVLKVATPRFHLTVCAPESAVYHKPCRNNKTRHVSRGSLFRLLNSERIGRETTNCCNNYAGWLKTYTGLP